MIQAYDRMTDNKYDEEKLIKQIRKLFEAIPDEYIPTEDELQFLDERNRLEADHSIWSLDGIVENYDKLLEYGLVDKILKKLKFLIVLQFETEREKFIKSEFYRLFEDHKIMKEAYLEYISRQNC